MNRFFQTGEAHPARETLALYSRRDLPLFSRLRLKTHLLQCANCRRETELFTSSVGVLKQEAAGETLTAFEAVVDWRALEQEMLGNIVVGVAAARCIENVGRKPGWLVRSCVVAGVAALFALGWMTHIPSEQSAHLRTSLSTLVGFHRAAKQPDVVQAVPGGIEVNAQGVTLTILHPSSAVVSLSGSSSMQARYIDDTGQLTITNVYGQ